MVPVFVAEKVGTDAFTGLLNASCKIMVTVEVEVPSGSTGPVPVMVECALLAEP